MTLKLRKAINSSASHNKVFSTEKFPGGERKKDRKIAKKTEK